MRITKYVHSCLEVKEGGKTFLIDPGNYTAESKALNLDSFENIDYLLITHEHPDHMHLPLIKQIISRFEKTEIISNNSVKIILGNEGMSVSVNSNELVSSKNVNHEKVFGINPPENSLFKINNLLTIPGDSLSFDFTTKILALPVQAPWGSLTQAVDLAIRLKPEIIIPIHDWHWNESAREVFYKRLEDYFKKFDIRFLSLQTGIEVNV